MVKRLACLALVGAAACKGGLHTEKGNDFPCDFSQPEGVRDAVCSPGDVCGVDNHCRQYRYEGPQFELGANPPDFSTAVVRHPLVLTEPVTFVTRSIDLPDLRFFALTANRYVSLVPGSGVRVVPLGALSGADLTGAAVSHGSDPFALVLVRRGAEDVVLRFQDPSFDGGQELPFREGDRLRSGAHRIGLLTRGADAGLINVLPMAAARLDVRIDGGPPMPLLEARYLASPTGDELLGLVREGLTLSRQGGQGSTLISGGEPMPPELALATARPEMRVDSSGTVAAFTVAVDGGLARVLSTWRLDRVMQPSAVRLWADCRPCRFAHIANFSPTFESSAPVVEVLCEADVGATLSLVRVTGSAAADSAQPCTVEALDAPFPLTQVNKVSRGRRAAEGEPPLVVFDDAVGSGVALGGRRGQLWAGPSFSRALPRFLERTPSGFGALPSKGGGRLDAVITDRYLAIVKDPALGFEVLDLNDVGVDLPEGTIASAFVGGALGWGVLSTGDLAFVDARATDGGTLAFGPRLLDNRGAAAQAPYFAEAVTELDGGVISFVLTADDSVYFVPAESLGTTPLPNTLPPVSPQLTPAPSSPVRSFALERSALGTDGRTRVRAYGVAGRTLFLVTFDGTPPRWATTPLVLQAGEPLEVWMDHPLGGLGRAGYRDGQVFTLPGGFLLVNELPRDAGTNAMQVLDYENLGGWPVAMTSNGLFEAHYDVLEGGKLDNRFPDGGVNKAMSWRRVTLPDGGEPWLGKTSRLQVTQETLAYDGGFTVPGPAPASVRVFRLLVYTDEQVVEAGRLVRR